MVFCWINWFSFSMAKPVAQRQKHIFFGKRKMQIPIDKDTSEHLTNASLRACMSIAKFNCHPTYTSEGKHGQ